jgi:membrane fusion protein (multidrug efflux system)
VPEDHLAPIKNKRTEPQEDPGKDQSPDRHEQNRPSFIRRHPFWVLIGMSVVLIVAAIGYGVWLVYFHPF